MNKFVLDLKNHKLINLLIADKMIFPEIFNSAISNQLKLSELIKRHSRLIFSFSEILGGIEENQADAVILPELAAFIRGIEPQEVLHVPGWLHETYLTKTTFSSGQSVRKKQGSFYTPFNIIKHMIQSSFNYLSKGKPIINPDDVKILDPACGSGSFLIECQNYLISRGVLELTAIKMIHGTDIDIKAIELTRYVIALSVLSKAKYSVDPMEIKMLLEKQIKLGNSLLQPGDQLITIDNQSPVIRWSNDFPDLFNKKDSNLNGFDLVIGNPPYLSNKAILKEEKKYYNESYYSAYGQYDLSVLFMEQGLKLLKENGVLNFITSNKFMAADYGKKLRQRVLSDYTILNITDVSTIKSFKNTSVYPVIFTVRKLPPAVNHKTRIINAANWNDLYHAEPITPNQRFFSSHKDSLITSCLNNKVLNVVNKLHTMNCGLPNKVIRCGLAMTGFRSWVNKDTDRFNRGKSHPFIQSGDIEAFNIKSRSWIDITCFASEKRLKEESVPKLVLPGIAKKLTAAVDISGSLVGRVYYIRQSDTEYDLSYLAVLFNSILLDFYYRVLYWPVHLEGGYLRFNSTYIANIPVYRINQSDDQKRSIIRSLINTGSILMNRQIHQKEREIISSQLNAGVFALYDVTPNEAEAIMEFQKVPVTQRTTILNLMNTFEFSKVAER